jgi:hypothetical protein
LPTARTTPPSIHTLISSHSIVPISPEQIRAAQAVCDERRRTGRQRHSPIDGSDELSHNTPGGAIEEQVGAMSRRGMEAPPPPITSR